MFFTKEDRAKLEAIHKMLELLLYAPQTDELYFHYPPELQQKIKNIKLKELNRFTKEKEPEPKVSGSMDLSGAAEEEEDIIRENIAARLSQETTNRPFFEEERMDARELEVME